ncbi:MAG: hypothetical protein V3V31_14425 [Methylococcales bacterium]
MIGRSGQNGLFRSRFSILGQPPRVIDPDKSIFVCIIVYFYFNEYSTAI